MELTEQIVFHISDILCILATSDGVSRPIFASLGLDDYRSRLTVYYLETLNTQKDMA